jgi:hypothetical protein
MRTAHLYDTDFAEWSRHNAELLRSGRTSEADLEHIAEEIEDLGKRERRSRNAVVPVGPEPLSYSVARFVACWRVIRASGPTCPQSSQQPMTTRLRSCRL